MSPAQNSVMVVIVNYRTSALVIECLRSLESQIRQHANATVTVVDNASGDHSAEKIAEAINTSGWSSWARVLESPVNGGFAYGNNFAIRPALASANPPDCFWLLNPDTVARPNSLNALSDFMRDHPEVGIGGGGVDLSDGTPWRVAFRFPTMLSELERGFAFGPVTRLLASKVVTRAMGDVPERVDWICGASMMIRRTVFETIGLMDEDYFLYFEETDYSLHASRAGIQTWYVPQSRIIHIAGQSTGVTAKTDTPKRLPAYWFNSRRRFFVKNYGRLYAAVTDILWMLAYSLGRLRLWMQRKPHAPTPHYLADFFRHSALWTSHIEERRPSKANA